MDVPNVTLQPACFCGMFDVVCRLTHGVVWSISDGVIHRRNETYVMKQLENYMQITCWNTCEHTQVEEPRTSAWAQAVYM
jgi:hypothetical protein